MATDDTDLPDAGAARDQPAALEAETDPAGADFPDIAEMSYEQARDELVDVVARLEGGQVGLEESMTMWRRGEALAAHCTAWLSRAEAALSQQDQQ